MSTKNTCELTVRINLKGLSLGEVGYGTVNPPFPFLLVNTGNSFLLIGSNNSRLQV